MADVDGAAQRASLTMVRGRLEARVPVHLAVVDTELELRLGGVRVATAMAVAADPGWTSVTFAVPPAALTDGAAFLDLHALPQGEHLARYTLFCGAALPDDAASALALLQEEVQSLKRAFMAEAASRKLTMAERPLLIAEAVEAALAEIEARTAKTAAPPQG